jgi:hypothetical protein
LFGHWDEQSLQQAIHNVVCQSHCCRIKRQACELGNFWCSPNEAKVNCEECKTKGTRIKASKIGATGSRKQLQKEPIAKFGHTIFQTEDQMSLLLSKVEKAHGPYLRTNKRSNQS